MSTEIAIPMGGILGALLSFLIAFLRFRLSQRKLTLGHEDAVLHRLERENQRLEKRVLALESERDLEERRAVVYRRALYNGGLEVPDVL